MYSYESCMSLQSQQLEYCKFSFATSNQNYEEQHPQRSVICTSSGTMRNMVIQASWSFKRIEQLNQYHLTTM